MISDGTSPDAVQVNAVGPAACAAVAWRMAGRLRLTIVVKATLIFAPDEPMVVAEPEPVQRAELHHRDNDRALHVDHDQKETSAMIAPAAFECGAAKVVVEKSGKITITGTRIEVAADGPLSLKGADVAVSASGNLKIDASGPVQLTGSGPMQIDASGAVKLKGSQVGIN